ncbi:MAG: ribonuclease III [Rickettsiales bacterium]|nr:ribonuclease III [Rickettsiales bacterium]|tara:strand:+ start:24803 stop:25492 length:690 start_codon:yes stop_codon:yes gene_type:complete
MTQSIASLAELQNRINYHFNDIGLLQKALRHSSQVKKNSLNDFERLEFLGDRVVGLCLAESLYENNNQSKEGALAKKFSYLASREVMSEIAQEINLGAYLIVAKNDDLLKKNNQSVLADALESLFGAIFLDGGFESGRCVFKKLWADKFDDDAGIIALEAKSTLQEWAQARGLELPKYQVINVTGPDHDPRYTVRVEVDERSIEAEGSSKKSAEQLAAKNLFNKLMSGT